MGLALPRLKLNKVVPHSEEEIEMLNQLELLIEQLQDFYYVENDTAGQVVVGHKGEIDMEIIDFIEQFLEENHLSPVEVEDNIWLPA